MCGGPAIITVSTSHINKRVLTVAKCSSFASVNAHEVSTNWLCGVLFPGGDFHIYVGSL